MCASVHATVNARHREAEFSAIRTFATMAPSVQKRLVPAHTGLSRNAKSLRSLLHAFLANVRLGFLHVGRRSRLRRLGASHRPRRLDDPRTRALAPPERNAV